MTQQLIVTKKKTDFVHSFEFSSGTGGSTIAFAQQRRYAREDQATLYTDQIKSSPLCTVSRYNDISAQVLDETGRTINNLLVEHPSPAKAGEWSILGHDNTPIYTVRAHNAHVARLLHLLKPIPSLRSCGNVVATTLGHRLDIIDPNGRTVGRYSRLTPLRPTYRLTVDETAAPTSDWRTFASLCLLLDL